ncbi:hypothetical protein CPAV1605_1508 [seawater metagenome]|uniref:Uncharacterized protein n=1 Tax=seawater metagenome TaxID=1561972 RepID=A0A5E8CMD2_9ZZZZ
MVIITPKMVININITPKMVNIPTKMVNIPTKMVNIPTKMVNIPTKMVINILHKMVINNTPKKLKF